MLEDSQGLMKPSYEKKSEFKVPLIIAIVSIVLVGGVLGYLYFNNMNKPINVLKTVCKEVSKSLNLDASKRSSSFSINLKATDKFGKYKDLVNVINKINVNGSMSIDTTKKLLNLNTNLKYANKSIINYSAHVRDGKIFLYLGDLYDKYIYSSLDRKEGTTSNYQKEFETITNSLSDNFFKSLKDEYFVTEKVKLNNQSVKKISLILEGENLKTFHNDLKENFKNDSKFVNALNTLTGLTVEKLEQEFSQSELYDVRREVSLYLDGKELKRMEFSIGNIFKIDLVKNNSKYDYEITSQQANMTGTIMIDKNNLEFTTNEDSSDLSLEMQFKMVTDYDQEVIGVNPVNTIDASNITKEDMSKIVDNLYKNEAFIELLTALSETNLLN